MAIKSKKNRSKPRQVARAPRREPVPVPTPFLAKRWVQLLAAVIVGVFVMMVFVWVTNGLRENNSAADADASAATKRKAATAYQAAVEEAVGSIGVVNPGAVPTVFPDMLETLQQMQQGKTPDQAATVFDDAAQGAGRAIRTIISFDVAGTIADQGFDSTEATVFTSSAQQLSISLQQFQRCAQTAGDVVGLDESAVAKDLLTATQGFCDSAQAQLSQAWSDYQAALQTAGIVEAPGGAGDIPGLDPTG